MSYLSSLRRHKSEVAKSGWTTKSDIEMQRRSTIPETCVTKDGRTAALECLFGISAEQLVQWPGSTAYCEHLEECFQPLLADQYASMWTAIGKQRPVAAADCWSLFCSVTSAVRGLRNGESSIEDIWDCLLSSVPAHAETPPAPPSELGKTAGLLAIFAVLCWATMTLQPRPSWTDFNGLPPTLLVVQQPSDLPQPGLRMDMVRRPIPAVFRTLQRKIISTNRWRQPINYHGNASTALYVSSLNYASLKMTGKIRLVWVDSLSNHLDFDFSNRRLSIFRFPSFCALEILHAEEGRRVPVFVELIEALYSLDSDASKAYESNHIQLHQEVLMSYRLLFGQTGKARNLVKDELRGLKTGNRYDQLLDLLCTRPCDRKIRSLPVSLWPVTCRSFEGFLQEEDAYSSQDDFPRFGQRLAKLQAFNLRQQPSRLRDLWRDRRNPLQWYTFWAVLVVGGLSIVLAFLQLAVGAAQLAISLHSSGTCS